MRDEHIAAKIKVIQERVEYENPGFAEHLATYPEVVTVDLDEIVGQTDIYDPQSVARAYFIFTYAEFQRRNKKGRVPSKVTELMLELFESAMVGRPPQEQIAQARAVIVTDAIEMACGPSPDLEWLMGWQDWGAGIRRLHDFEDRLRLKRRPQSKFPVLAEFRGF